MHTDGQSWYTILSDWIIYAYRWIIMVYDLKRVDYLCVQMDNYGKLSEIVNYLCVQVDYHGILALATRLSLRTDGQSWYTIFIEWIISENRWTITVYGLKPVENLCV